MLTSSYLTFKVKYTVICDLCTKFLSCDVGTLLCAVMHADASKLYTKYTSRVF